MSLFYDGLGKVGKKGTWIAFKFITYTVVFIQVTQISLTLDRDSWWILFITFTAVYILSETCIHVTVMVYMNISYNYYMYKHWWFVD